MSGRIIALAAVILAGAVNAQTTASYTPPRTPDGQPDLQGVWTNVTITPLERPANLAGKEFFTPAEARQYEKDTVERNNADRRDGGAQADLSRAYNDAWYDRGTRVVETLRTSLVIDPPDGRIPRKAIGARGSAARVRQAARGSGRPVFVRALYPVAHRRAADDAELLQQQLSDRAGARIRDHPGRNDS